MKRFYFFVFVFMLLCCGTVHADEWIISKDDEGNIKSVRFSKSDTSQITMTSDDFFRQFLKIDNKDAFKLDLAKSAIRGMHFERYQQYYKGTKVEGGYYSFRFRNNEMLVAKGNYVNVNEINPIPEISEDSAICYFMSFLNIPHKKTTDLTSSLVIKKLPSQGINKAFLVYKIETYNPRTSMIETGYIDAHTGGILYHEQKSFCSSATGIFHTLYNDNKTGGTDYYQGVYRLCDSTRGNGVHTFKMIDGYNVNELTDNDNNWTGSELGVYHMALDVHWTLGQIYDVLKNTYGHNSYDGQDGAINSYITSSHATQFFPNPTMLYYNNSISNSHLPEASIDIVAHEFGHAILYYTDDWTSPGALHEGFADIWGILFEHRIDPNKDFWKLGEDIMIGYSCMRNFAYPYDPNAYEQISKTYGVVPGNSNDPHLVGGIFPYWFYLLVNGGSGTNDVNNFYQVYPVGFDMMEQLIVYTSLNPSYLEECTSFSDVRSAFIEAANDMGNPYLAMQVANAWYAVGVGSQPSQISLNGPTTPGNSSVYYIANLPDSLSVTWSLPGYNNLLTANQPSANQCTLNNSSHQHISDTLTASIFNNSNVLLATLKKKINTADGFSATYSQTMLPDMTYISGTLYDNGIINCGQGTTLSITSSDFYGASFTFSTTSLTPIPLEGREINGINSANPTYSLSGNTLQVTYTMNASLQMSTVTCINGDKVIKFRIHAHSPFDFPVPGSKSNIDMIVAPNGISTVSVSLALKLRDAQNDGVEELQLPDEWDLNVFNAQTGRMVYSSHITGGPTTTIDTTGWQPGIYILCVKAGKSVLVQKLKL